jgi:hypothetical protein
MVDGQGCDFEAQGIGVGFVLMFEREVTSARELGGWGNRWEMLWTGGIGKMACGRRRRNLVVDLVKSVLRLYSVVRARSRGFDL